MFDFVDNLEPSDFNHIVMFYEEPEYARLVKIRFLSNGLKNGECCIYSAPANEDLWLTKTALLQYPLDVDHYMNMGILQLHSRTPSIIDRESCGLAIKEFREAIVNTFYRAPQHSSIMPTKVRGVGSRQPYVFADKILIKKGLMAASQLLLEEVWQSESKHSFEGMWMCEYYLDDITGSMDEHWMKHLLATHDAVLFLRKLSNGIALDIRK